MKPPKLFVKIAVLSFFFLFLVGFVAYRSGALDKWFAKESSAVPQTEINSIAAATDNTITQVDSPPRNAFSVRDSAKLDPPPKGKKWIMMSGSKSGALIPILVDIDTPNAKVNKPVMPGSKSGRLIYPKKDTSKN